MADKTPFDAKLDRLVARHAELSSAMADPARTGEFAKLAKEYSELTSIVEAITALRQVEAERQSLEELVGGGDAEMKKLAEIELDSIKKRLPVLEEQVKTLLLPKDEADEKNAILEVRAGTGGEEAALVAAELFRMYQRYAALKGWRVELLELSETGLGGLKEGIASISGRGVFARLKFESGVHRVQRV
ncbi:MAG: PCRF domain-containing protein, partial [Stellaceae bacterium]